LDLGENQIVHLVLWGLPKLTVLDISDNKLRSQSDLLHLSDRMPVLATLDLRGNPLFVDQKTYYSMLLSLPTLTVVSGLAVRCSLAENVPLHVPSRFMPLLRLKRCHVVEYYTSLVVTFLPFGTATILQY
jgi:Leucine-rich repeat (LRR) protein